MTQADALKPLFESDPVEKKRNIWCWVLNARHWSGKGNSKTLPEAHCQLWHMPLATKHTLVYTSMMIVLLKLMNQLHPENVFLYSQLLIWKGNRFTYAACYLGINNLVVQYLPLQQPLSRTKLYWHHPQSAKENKNIPSYEQCFGAE